MALNSNTMTLNEPARIVLAPETEIVFAVPPQKPDPAGSHGGMAAINIPAVGTYRVALGAGAWVDVVQDGIAVRSSGHSHGANCLAKMVEFPLHAGRAIIQISAAAQTALQLLVSQVH